MKLKVSLPQRLAKARAHTATHLLHAELDRLLKGTKQAGSLVDEDYLRFDFSASKPLTREQIYILEKNINKYIYNAFEVEKIEMSFEEAIKKGAKAFFDEKYGDVVRVVVVKGACNGGDSLSIELCGGTHVNNTSEIGAFKIIGQEAVASGIRRVIAVTGPKVAEYAIDKDNFIYKLSDIIDSSPKQILDKISKIIKDFNDLQAKYKSLEDKLVVEELKKVVNLSFSKYGFDKIIKVPNDDIFMNINFKQLGNLMKNLYGNINFLIYNQNGNFFAYSGKKDLNLKNFLREYDLKGGGNEYQVQGKDVKILDLF